jgi:hypothetical protein
MQSYLTIVIKTFIRYKIIVILLSYLLKGGVKWLRIQKS